jgi:predicted amidohydrolase YtcJ
VKGPLVPGYYADLAVLSQDPVTATAAELRAIKCTATLVNGRLVHGALA